MAYRVLLLDVQFELNLAFRRLGDSHLQLLSTLSPRFEKLGATYMTAE